MPTFNNPPLTLIRATTKSKNYLKSQRVDPDQAQESEIQQGSDAWSNSQLLGGKIIPNNTKRLKLHMSGCYACPRQFYYPQQRARAIYSRCLRKLPGKCLWFAEPGSPSMRNLRFRAAPSVTEHLVSGGQTTKTRSCFWNLTFSSSCRLWGKLYNLPLVWKASQNHERLSIVVETVSAAGNRM